MAKTKGVAFLNVRSFVEQRGGDAKWAELVAPLTVDERRALESVVAVGWYDLELYAAVLRRVPEVLGESEASVIRALGRYQAETDLKKIHRVFLSLANPSFTIEKTAALWRRYHDSGDWKVERRSPTHVLATIDGLGVVDRTLCAVIGAYMGRLLELVGARALRFEHPRCRARGDRACVFEARWEA